MLERSATFARQDRDSDTPRPIEFKRFLEYMPAAIAMFDRQLRYLLASRRWQENFGVAGTEGASFYEDCPGNRSRWQEAQQNLLQGAVSVWEEAITNADGMRQWVKWEVQPWYDEVGEMGGAIVSAQEITDLKNVEEGLQRSLKELEDLKLALDIASIVAITDTRGTITHVNDTFCQISQYSREELLGQNHRILNSDYHPPKFFKQLWSTIASGQVWQGEIKNRAKDGTFYWVNTTIVPCVDDRGKPYQYIAIRNDISDRKRAKTQLQESQQFLQLVLDNIPQLIFWKNRNSEYLGCNQNFSRVAGLENSQEIRGKTDYDLPWTPEEADWYQDFDRRVMKSGKPRLHIIETQQQADGKVAWLDTCKIPLRDADSNVIGILGTIEDITERKHAEKILQRSNEELEEIVQQRTVALRKAVTELKREIRDRRQTQQQLHQQAQFLQSIWDGVDYGMFILDVLDDGEEYRFSRFNPTLARTSQVPIDRLLGKTLKESFPPDVANLYRQRYQECTRSGRSLNFEERMEADNVEKWWLLNLAPLRNETGQIYQIVVTLTDITHRKQMETDRVRSEARFRQFVENANDLIYSVDSHGYFTYLSPQFPQMFGYDLAEFQGESFAPLVHPEDLSKVIVSNQQLFETGKRQLGLEFRARHRDGFWIWIVCNNTPMHNTEGQIIGFQGIARDISDRRQIEEELRSREQHLREINSLVPGAIYQYQTDLQTGQNQFTYISPKVLELFEVDREAVLTSSDSIWEMIHPEDLPRLQASVAKSVHNRTYWFDEFRIITPSGKEKWIRGQSELAEAPDGFSLHNGIFLDISDRKTIEADLAKSEAQLQAVLNNAPAVIYVKDLDGKYLLVNREFETVLQISPEKAIGITDADLFPPEVVSCLRENDCQAITTGQAVRVEETIPLRDGWHTYLAVKFPLFDADGKIYATCGISTDISDRKAAETELMLFKHAVECSSNAIGMADPQGNHIYQNPAFSQLYECETVESFNEFGGISAVFTDQSVAQEIIEAILAGESWMGEVQQRSRTGRLLPVLMRADTIKDQSGNVIGLIGTTTDISNLKQAQKELQQSHSELAAIFQALPDLYFRLDAGGMILDYKAEAHSNASQLPAMFLGQPIGQCLPSQFKEQLDGAIGQTLQTQSSVNLEYELSELETPKYYEARFVPLGEEQLITIVRDISDRKVAEFQLKQQAQELENAFQELKRTQAQMLQSEKMSSLGQMVAGVAHEINNPVNFIHGNLTHAQDYVGDLLNLIELYGNYYPTPAIEIQEEVEKIELDFIVKDITKMFQSMRIGTNRIREIVLSLRNFSRLDESDRKEANLHDGIENTLMILQNRLKAKSDRPAIEVIKNYGKLPLIECYPGQLNQVFMNILSNAIDSLESRFAKDALEDRDKNRTGEEIYQNPGQISIDTELVKAKTVRIRIKDNGIGISESIQNRIFDPFFTTKEVGKGTGLGMSISYQIITDRHSGSIACLSSPRKGAEFIIEIPLQQ